MVLPHTLLANGTEVTVFVGVFHTLHHLRLRPSHCLSVMEPHLPEWEGLTWLKENLVSRRVLTWSIKLPRIKDLRVRMWADLAPAGL